MASQDFIFPLLPRNTSVKLNTEIDRVVQLEKKQKIKEISEDDNASETQHARIEERQKQQQQQSKQQSKQKKQDSKPDPDDHKGQNLDTYA